MKKKILNYLYEILSRKDYAEVEILKKLEKKFPNDKDFFGEALETLRRYNYINDEKYVRNFILSKGKSGYGPWYIYYKLLEKSIKIDISYISELLNENLDLKEIALNLLKNKASFKRNKDAMAVKKKYFDFLKRRGFDTNMIIEIMQEEV